MTTESDRLEPISLIAACSCGSLTVTLSAAPQSVHACSCSACQRDSGSAFTYTSFFAESAVVAIEGEHRNWRRTAASGRWIESSFCARCGNTVVPALGSLAGDLRGSSRMLRRSDVRGSRQALFFLAAQPMAHFSGRRRVDRDAVDRRARPRERIFRDTRDECKRLMFVYAGIASRWEIGKNFDAELFTPYG